MQYRLYLVALFAVIALLVLPGYAPAAPFGPPEEAAYQNAITWWGAQPSLCGTIIKSVEPLEGEAGEATIPSQPGTECKLQLDPATADDPMALCVVMRHEVGHLLGHEHSTDPSNIMYPTPNAELAAPDCLLLGAPSDQERLEVKRQQSWQEWKETRRQCEVSRGPFRSICWHRLRREAVSMRERYAMV